MKKMAVVLFAFAVMASGCSESGSGGTGGSGGTAGSGGSAGSGGTAGTGGSTGSGGEAGSGGTGGEDGGGGTGGSAGSGGDGGTGGSGGSEPALNPCEPNPCENFGQCETEFDEISGMYSDATCVCTEDFSGERCEIGPPTQEFACVKQRSYLWSRGQGSVLYENGGPYDSLQTSPYWMTVPTEDLDFPLEAVTKVEICNLDRSFEVGGRIYDGDGKLIWTDWMPGTPLWEHLDRGIACMVGIPSGEQAFNAPACSNAVGIEGFYASNAPCFTVNFVDFNPSIHGVWWKTVDGDLETFCDIETLIDYHSVENDDYRNHITGTVRITYGNPAP